MVVVTQEVLVQRDCIDNAHRTACIRYVVIRRIALLTLSCRCNAMRRTSQVDQIPKSKRARQAHRALVRSGTGVADGVRGRAKRARSHQETDASTSTGSNTPGEMGRTGRTATLLQQRRSRPSVQALAVFGLSSFNDRLRH